MAEQLGSNYYNTPYKFNGKELDEETGLYYYGARYYDPRISIWLSVDSEFEEFPNASPYNYCLQSPLNLVDPDGRSPIPPFTFAGYGIMLNSIKETYTNMSNGDSFFTAFAKAQSSNAHSLLDAAGLVPVCGEIFDGINASWYGLEGDYTNAGFSAAASELLN